MGFALHSALPLEYLKTHRILHRDVKPENYVIDSNMVMKLTDFGIARQLGGTVSSFTQLGTWRWMAPEVHGVQGKNELSPLYDIFSLGLVLWYLVCRQLPYAECKSDFAIAQAITSGKRPDIPSECPDQLAKLIKRCWDGDHRKRPDISDIISEIMEMNEQLGTSERLSDVKMPLSEKQVLTSNSDFQKSLDTRQIPKGVGHQTGSSNLNMLKRKMTQSPASSNETDTKQIDSRKFPSPNLVPGLQVTRASNGGKQPDVIEDLLQKETAGTLASKSSVTISWSPAPPMVNTIDTVQLLDESPLSEEDENFDQKLTSKTERQDDNLTTPEPDIIRDVCANKSNENFIFFTPKSNDLMLSMASLCLHQYENKQRSTESMPFKAIVIVSNRDTITPYLELFKQGFTHTAKVTTVGEIDQLETIFYSRDCSVVVVTAQILVNALESREVLLKSVSMVIFDECHRTSQKHPYNKVMKQYLEEKRKAPNLAGNQLGEPGEFLPQIIGLSDSPGEGPSNDVYQNILTLCANMDVKSVVLTNGSDVFPLGCQTAGRNDQDLSEKQAALNRFLSLSDGERIDQIYLRQIEIKDAIAEKKRIQDLKTETSDPHTVAIMCTNCKNQITFGNYIVKRGSHYDCVDPSFESKVRVNEKPRPNRFRTTDNIGTITCRVCFQQLGLFIHFLDHYDGKTVTRRGYGLGIKSLLFKILDDRSTEPRSVKSWQKAPCHFKSI